jgi:hypothetical protein
MLARSASIPLKSGQNGSLSKGVTANFKGTTAAQGDQTWPAQNADEWAVPSLWTIRSCEQFYTDSSLEFLGNRMVRNTKAKHPSVSIQL